MRSAGAVLAGFVVTFVLSLGTDQVFHTIGVFPPWGETMSDALFGLATAYRTVYTVLGGWITARLAPDRPVHHAVVLGTIGLAFATVGVVATWNLGPEFGPRWYPIVVAAEALPCVVAGALLHRR